MSLPAPLLMFHLHIGWEKGSHGAKGSLDLSISETLNRTREHWGHKALAVGSGRESSVCLGTLGQGGGHWSEGAFVKATACHKREKIKVCAHSGKREREGNKQRAPKCCLGKCVVFQRSLRLCRGRESPFYLLRIAPGLSVAFPPLCLF